jgi:hypothetical protein
MVTGEMTAAGAGVLPGSVACLRPVVVHDLVRVGNPNDGGYVVPESVISSAGCLLSFGVNDDWTFEQDFHRRNPGCIIHAYDHTVNRRHFFRRAKMDFKRCLRLKGGAYDRFKKSWKTYREYQEFFSSNRIHYEERIFDRVDGENDATMEKVFSRVGGDFRVVVKMDIEGSEYRVIHPLLQYQARVDLLIVEFHDTGPLRLTFLDCIEQLSAQYQIVHVHGNNGGGAAADGLPDILEISFLSRRFNFPPVYRDELPLKGLDAPNLPHRPDFHLRFQSA